MSIWNKITTNIPKVDLQSYNVLIVGGWKAGKTRAFKEIIERHYPDNPRAGLLLAWESGYRTWEINQKIDLYSVSNSWEFFKNEIVPGLIEEAKKGSDIKIIANDTIDMMYESASDYILQRMSQKYGKKFTSIGEVGVVTKGADNGYILLTEELNRELNKLKIAGYGFFNLGWVKEKQTETIDSLIFHSLELALPNTGRKVFESQADLICCLYPEVKVLDKEGNILEENIINNKGKTIASKFHSTEMYMYFRPNNYINISGGRFLNLPEKVPYSASNFLEVFENAVKGQLKDSDNIEEIRKAEIKDREKRTKEVFDEMENNKSIDEIIEQIKQKGIKLKDNKVPIRKINKVIGNLKYDSIQDAKDVLEQLDNL